MAAATDQLHTYAMEAEKNLEQLATGISGVGAPDAVVKSVTDMASACRKIADGLAKSMQHEPPPQPKTTDDAMAAHMASRRAAGPPAAAQPPAY